MGLKMMSVESERVLYKKEEGVIVYFYIIYDKYRTKDFKTFVGVAKCSPNDEWNPVLGKRIAESRAKLKAYRYFRNILARDCKNFAAYFDRIKDTLEAYEYYIDREVKHIADLVNE